MTEKEEPIVDVQETITKAEKYFEENKKSLSVIGAVIIILVGGYFLWTKAYIAPMEEEARTHIYMAERYFEKDSIEKAINGDGKHFGFKYITENYGLTTSGNLAHLYLGLCYLHLGQYEEAINELKEYDGSDMMLAPVCLGAIGDAYAELGKTDNAISQYLKASKENKNNFISPIYLMKAATLYESLGKYKESIAIYEQIKSDYSEVREGRDIEKYISRAKAKAGID